MELAKRGAEFSAAPSVSRATPRFAAHFLVVRRTRPHNGMDIDARRNRLIAWLEVIKDDVQDLMLDHHVFWEVQAILKANPKVTHASGLFNQWMASSFVQSTAVGVRRQAKGGDDSVSLKRFLNEVRQYPELISRRSYLAFFADSPEWLTKSSGHGYFDSLAGSGGACIRATVVDRQLAELDTAVSAIEHYVDRRVAHYDQRGLAKPVPTFKDLEGALKLLEELVIFYWTLLKGASMVGLTPAIQYHWQDVFEFAWVDRAEPGSDDASSPNPLGGAY